ncbi:MAG TPA: HAD-IC family P-type ATPase [Jatrophihabitans sp.]|nr:HAD-IC family P-type ATPase [Jatrophihabitans sp.]
MTSTPVFVTPEAGLTADQVEQRVAAGRTNAADTRTSRSVGQIVRANVITPFNGLLATLFVLILLTGRWQNGLFGLVIVANTVIGVYQEVRAKRTLDRLAVLNAPHARVVRDGQLAEIAVEDVVADELLELRTGDQVVADGRATDSAGLEIDESLLTGESDPIPKAPGDEVRSGSIVVAGSGRFQATAVGAEAYATALTAEAKKFTRVRSELVGGTNTLLRWISVMMLVVGPLVLWSQFRSTDNDNWQDAVTGAVAALVGMVPEGLVLLTSLAFLVAAVTLTRRQTLVQELPAVEVLARVDVVCLDKTGTLTHGDIVFDELQLLDGGNRSDVERALALSAASPDANATATALAAKFPDAAWTRCGSIPFSSARKWSAVSADGHGTWVLGAPEMVLPSPRDAAARAARDRADVIAAQGRRVLLLAADPVEFDGEPEHPQLPPALTPQALVVLAERVRDDAPDTMRYFVEQGVALKVISGDNPRTVGAVAAAVGVPGVHEASDAVDARTLPTDLDELGAVLDAASVFGRVSPQQKRAVVAALQRRGHVIAMTGDGVNDAMALKDADIGVAMGNGSAATRAVAQLVLLDGRFSHLPNVVAEGRRVIANIERAANLFLVKNVYSLVLALIIVVTASAYPLAPIQLTLISAVTIGIPAFFLALGPNTRRYVPGFLRRVLRFSVPTGVVIGADAYVGYQLIRAVDPSAGVDGGRTVATLIVLICSWWVLLVLARPLAGWKLLLVAAMAGIVAVIVVVPVLATDVFLLHPTPLRVTMALVLGGAGVIAIELAYRSVAVAVAHHRHRAADRQVLTTAQD